MRSLFLLPLLLASFTYAQAPQLLATNPDNPNEKPHPIALSKAEVQLLIAGRLCQTTMTLTFHNDGDRVLEGDLIFPLPENATVCGYGLDVGGQIVEAVTIEKDKARVVFETESRKGIDPGIIEKVEGNNFRTRVHPIPAKGSRTVRVQYVSEPSVAGDQLVFNLPLQWLTSTPELTVQVESISTSAPKVEALPQLKFQSDGDHHLARQTIEKAAFNGEVVAILPLIAAKPIVVEQRTHSTVSAENVDPKTAQAMTRTDCYFVASDLPTPTPMTTTASRGKPARIAIAWDASLSRGKVDHAKEFELLTKHLASLGDATVEVIAFRNVPKAAKSFKLKGGDATEILKYLASLSYDGGTNLSSLSFAKDTPGVRDESLPSIAYYLLFTDGLCNLGPELPTEIGVPVFAVSNDPRSNHNLLRRLAVSSGGQYLNLQSLTMDQAVEGLTDRPFSLISIDADPKQVAEIYPRLPRPVHGPVTLAGRLLTDTATITLNYGRDGVVSQRVPLTITRAGASTMNLVSRQWAQLKLADLSAIPDHNQTEITALGKEFNLVTPYTSMIVLETVDQYLRYKIIPPRSRGDIYAQFMQQIEQQQALAQTDEKAKIDRVVTMWQNRLAWWNQEFKYASDFKYRDPEVKKDVAMSGGTRIVTLRTGLSTHDSGRGGGGASGGESVRRELAQTPASSTPIPALDPAAPAVHSPAPLRQAVNPAHDVEDLTRTTPDFDHAPSFSLANNPREAGVTGGRTVQGGGGGGGGGGGLFGNSSTDERAPQAPGRLTTDHFDDYVTARGMTLGRPLSIDASITVRAWTPDTPYIKALQAAPADKAYSVYLEQRKNYESSPAFYLDCADFFTKANPEIALRILTNIPELALDDGRLLRIAAHRLQQIKQLDLAIDLFERVARLRPEEPQSFRDIALALADRADLRQANHDLSRARSDHERALELLHKVVMNPWDRFEEIEVIALTEANQIIAKANALPGEPLHHSFDPRLIKLLDPDLRIVMTWDTDNTDIDLHVTEPTGETCVYNHNRTTIGGALSKDFTQGYGPEEYLLHKAMPGEYKIQAHFYGNRDQQFVGPTTVQATIITHFGRSDEKRQSITLRLKDAKEMVDIGSVNVN